MVSCTKGILNDSLETTHQILQRVLPPQQHNRLAYLSGPSFAAEVAREQPSAVTVASTSTEVAGRIQTLLSTPRFRCYRTHDVAGVVDLQPAAYSCRKILLYCQTLAFASMPDPSCLSP